MPELLLLIDLVVPSLIVQRKLLTSVSYMSGISDEYKVNNWAINNITVKI